MTDTTRRLTKATTLYQKDGTPKTSFQLFEGGALRIWHHAETGEGDEITLSARAKNELVKFATSRGE